MPDPMSLPGVLPSSSPRWRGGGRYPIKSLMVALQQPVRAADGLPLAFTLEDFLVFVKKTLFCDHA